MGVQLRSLIFISFRQSCSWPTWQKILTFSTLLQNTKKEKKKKKTRQNFIYKFLTFTFKNNCGWEACKTPGTCGMLGLNSAVSLTCHPSPSLSRLPNTNFSQLTKRVLLPFLFSPAVTETYLCLLLWHNNVYQHHAIHLHKFYT